MPQFFPSTRAAVVLLLGAIAGCSRPQPPVAPPTPPVVEVVRPSAKEVVDYQDFTGRAKASDTTDIKARVTGYLNTIHFKDGDRVAAGQPLFDIDTGLYATELARAEAAAAQAKVSVTQSEALVVQANATLTRLTKDYLRVKNLPTASQSEQDQTEGQWEEAKAAVKVAEAAAKVATSAVLVADRQVAQAKKNIEYTHIVAPKAGRIGRHMLDAGSLVKADDTLLATLVVADPIYVYFDVDDRTMLRLNRLIADKKLNLNSDGKTVVPVGLPDEDGFDSGLVGTVKFIDTQLNPGTGTITLRADVDNPKGLLTSGLFVRVRLPIGEARKRLLVPEEAIATDQGLKKVFVLNEKDEVVSRQVNVGLLVGTERVVEAVANKPNSGVKETDRVITEGIQRVRDGTKVTVRQAGPKGPKQETGDKRPETKAAAPEPGGK
jgi:RND family efflux transporter MFP subunit